MPALAERCREVFVLELARRKLSYDHSKYWRAMGVRQDGEPSGREEFGHAETLKLLDLPEPPTAIYCHDGKLADGAAKAVAERGLKVGETFSILAAVTYEKDTPFSAFLSPHDVMAERLIETLQKVHDDPFAVCQVNVPRQFVDRGSVARLS
jgi:DNA-binding LacI/PurR family transcriptional regulator